MVWTEVSHIKGANAGLQHANAGATLAANDGAASDRSKIGEPVALVRRSSRSRIDAGCVRSSAERLSTDADTIISSMTGAEVWFLDPSAAQLCAATSKLAPTVSAPVLGYFILFTRAPQKRMQLMLFLDEPTNSRLELC